MSGSQEKTEKPTSKKQDDARKKGQIAKSKDLNAVFLLLFGGVATYLSSVVIYSGYRDMILKLWGDGFNLEHESMFSHAAAQGLALNLFMMMAPVLMAVTGIAVLSNLLQNGGMLFALEAVKPKFSKLNPLKGFKQLVSFRSLVEVIKSILKLLVVGGVVYVVLRSEQEAFLPLVRQETTQILAVIGRLALKMLLMVCVIMIVVCLVDYIFQKWQHLRDLRMSKHEVKEEHKQVDGDPFVKSRIRSIQKELAKQRMMSKVPDASVVITNPTHYAVALKYEPGMVAPQVTAKGVDYLALKIIKVARKHRVPVVPNPPLARSLYKQVKLEGTIPLELYQAVAKVIAHIYQQKRMKAS